MKKFTGYEEEKWLAQVIIHVPAFTFATDIRVHVAKPDECNHRGQAIGVELEDRENIKAVLAEIVPDAVALAIHEDIETGIKTNDAHVSGHTCIFPNTIDFAACEKRDDKHGE